MPTNLSPLLIGSHLLAFALGGVTCWLVVRKKGVALTTMTPHQPRGFGRKQAAGIGLLMVSLIIAGFGIQQWFYQRTGTQRDHCYETWGQTVVKTVNARTKAAKQVEKINQRHDHYLDAIILSVLALRQHPDAADTAGLDRALVRFSRVKVQDDKARANLTKTRARHPYPVLHCN